MNGENVYTMFALFFPAVTGIMAGANMSGDLRQPSRSIPFGTVASVLFTGVIYLSMTVMLCGTRTSNELIDNPLIIREISTIPGLIIVGVFAATLSSALGSMMGMLGYYKLFLGMIFLDLSDFSRRIAVAEMSRDAPP